MQRHRVVRGILVQLDVWATRLGRQPVIPASHALGRAGEELAYWFLRNQGYTILARNYRRPPHPGEIDLIAWDAMTLVFVEVKTRAARGEYPAEQSVNCDKRRHLIRLARAYARRRGIAGYRFDVVAVYGPELPRPEIVLHRDDFRDA